MDMEHLGPARRQVLASAGMFGMGLALAAVVLVFFDIKSRREERWLMAKFPEYAGYRRRVRKHIPYLY